jgi:hypothetical protein
VEGSSPEWHGKIVTNTYIDCTVYLKCPFTQQHIFIGLERFITFCNDREDEEWDIIVGDCEESSEQYPINNTTDLGYLCNKFSAGRHRDKTTNADLAFYPNAYHDNGEPGESPEEVLELVCRGVLIVEITDSGPNDGLWYVSSSSFVVDQEFITNKWIRPDGPNPPGADINWYGQNLLYCNDQFGYDITGAIGVAGWYQTIKDHENEGNHLASNGAGSGHHAQMRYDEETHRDLREAVEEFVSYSEISIKLAVANKFADIEDVVDGDPNHTYVKENWCPEVSAECIIYEATYDPVEMEWKSCFACKNTENQ